ncbi:MAG TPA: hypothetical protein VEL05_12245, partial [Candidatus Acidoferrum sp.]|nr:hypothetical protein [Candidatus Acidoferrum sp.]
MVKRGVTFSLAIPFDSTGPQINPPRRFNPIHRMILTGPDFTTGAFKRPGGVGFADDMVIMALQCATQWDALSQGFARTSCYTEIMGLRNVTITLDEDVVRWARIRAAERETSVSRLVGELLREKMLEDQSYEAAM